MSMLRKTLKCAVDVNKINIKHKIEMIIEKINDTIVVLLAQYCKLCTKASKGLKELCYTVDRLDTKCYELHDYLKKKEKD